MLASFWRKYRALALSAPGRAHRRVAPIGIGRQRPALYSREPSTRAACSSMPISELRHLALHLSNSNHRHLLLRHRGSNFAREAGQK